MKKGRRRTEALGMHLQNSFYVWSFVLTSFFPDPLYEFLHIDDLNTVKLF